MPSQTKASRIARTLSMLERSWSVSSTRSTKTPPWLLAQSQLKSAVRAPPMCKYPLGDGAKRRRGFMARPSTTGRAKRHLPTCFGPPERPRRDPGAASPPLWHLRRPPVAATSGLPGAARPVEEHHEQVAFSLRQGALREQREASCRRREAR